MPTAYQFTGQRNDGSTGLYYYGARYYDPALGRFISRDPSRYAGGFNLYGYCGNSPVDATDPSGLISREGLAEIADIASSMNSANRPALEAIRSALRTG